MVINVPAVYLPDCMIDRELWLMLTAQHPKKGTSYYIAGPGKKIKTEN